MSREPKKRNPLAKEVREPKYRQRVVPDKKRKRKKEGPEPES